MNTTLMMGNRTMIILLRLLMCFDAITLGIEQAFPQTHGFLPLGGSNLAQLGVLLLILLLCVELNDYRTAARRKARSEANSPTTNDDQ